MALERLEESMKALEDINKKIPWGKKVIIKEGETKKCQPKVKEEN